MTLNELVRDAHDRAFRKGWYASGLGRRNIPEMLALIHSEVSEALEAYRDLEAGQELNVMDGTNGGKPTGFPSELADIVIRVADLCGYLNIDLEEAVRVKSAYNETRPFRHGNKKA